MTWIRIDDQFADHPKVLTVGPLAGWLHVCALCYCGRYLTDGVIPAGQVRKLADLDDVDELVAKLVEARMWEPIDGGYRIHDYLVYNWSREKVLEERRLKAERQDRWRKAKQQDTPQTDDTPDTSTSQDANVDALQDGLQDAPVTPAPYPYPYHESSIASDIESSCGADAPTTTKPKATKKTTPVERHLMALWNVRHVNSSQRELITEYEQRYTYDRIVDVSKWCHAQGMAFGKALTAMRTALKNWDKPKAGQSGNGHQSATGPPPTPEWQRTLQDDMAAGRVRIKEDFGT